LAYAIVCDGCSTGGRTDVGARILAHATSRALQRQIYKGLPDAAYFNPVRDYCVDVASNALELRTEDMLATAVVAMAAPGEGALFHILGDGVIAFETHDGDLSMARFDWENNMPAYHAYRADGFSRFTEAHGGDPDRLALLSVGVNISRSQEFEPEFEDSADALRDGIAGVTVDLSASRLAEMRYLAVFTDGVTQVEGKPWHEVVAELLAFRSLNGDFAKRRMAGFLKSARTCGAGPVDDIAYSVIQIQPDEAA
jgi:hypothetical protein